ncbi:hypothetical protein ACOSQ4_004180 [Xanthoceras sorbifolium]
MRNNCGLHHPLFQLSFFFPFFFFFPTNTHPFLSSLESLHYWYCIAVRLAIGYRDTKIMCAPTSQDQMKSPS